MRLKLFILTFLADQITKWLSMIYLAGNKYAGFLRLKSFGLSYCKSEGYLFGIFMLTPYRRWLVILIMLVDLFIIQLFFRFYWLRFRRSRLTYISFSFIIGGFLGNFLDISVFKYVRDFILLPQQINLFAGRSTNLADIFIALGLIFLLTEFWVNRDFRKNLFKLRGLKYELGLLSPLFKLPLQDIKKLLK
ncbi:MAG: hypothetical protein COT09_01695 [Candidatus Hydromicrobium americanum]|nr:MAG: hypothetical protein COT09_01695 [Candidatus Hydromicrobium americanum]